MPTQRRNRQRKNRRNSQRGGEGFFTSFTNALGLGSKTTEVKSTEVPPAKENEVKLTEGVSGTKVDEVKLTGGPPAKENEVKLTEGVSGTKVDESGIELVTLKKTIGGKSKKNRSNKKRRSDKKKSNKKR